MPADEKKYMDVKEFRELGYLQELNRRFLHPLGLAIEVVILRDGTERLGAIWDSRDDPEGIIFGPDTMEVGKAQHVDSEYASRAHSRIEALGYIVQPATE